MFKLFKIKIEKAKSEKSDDAKLEGLTSMVCQPVAAVRANCTAVFCVADRSAGMASPVSQV